MIFAACTPGGGVNDGGNGDDDVIPTDKIVIKPSTITVEAAANNYIVYVSSPCSWCATTEEDWIMLETELGTDGKQQLVFAVEDYYETTERQGKIVVSNSDNGFYAELTVVQKAFVPELSVEPETLTFAAEGETKEIVVTANFEYTYSTNVDWLSIDKGENGILVTVMNNTEVDNRIAEITLSHEEYDLTKVVTISQGAFVPEFAVKQTSLEFDYKGGETTIEVTANFDYNVACPSWITYAKLENGVKITVVKNEEVEMRSAEITLSNEKYGLTKVVTISQGAFVPEFAVEQTSLEFDYKGGETTIEVTANFDYNVACPSWITYAKLENGVKITVVKNEEVEMRSAEITLSNEKYGLTKVVTISQGAFVPEFAVEQTSLEFDYKGGEATIEVTANFDYNVTCPSWITCKILENGVKITISANTSAEIRTAEVKIFSKKYNLDGAVSTVSQTGAPYKVGDILTRNGVEGIVFYVGSEGTKIMSVKGGGGAWSTQKATTGATDWSNGANNMAKIQKISGWENKYPAFKWCADLGEGWYLPALGELIEMYNQKSVLRAAGVQISSAWHWSSTENGEGYAYMLGFQYSSSSFYAYAKGDSFNVRAVFAF